ncbi:MAG: glycosyl hydrolase, partial [Streptomyces sp.]|nr:glycosyl hydrolase [Streptomyces sp.]
PPTTTPPTTTPPTTPPTSAPAGSCTVAYSVTNQWPGGFQASVTVNNTGSTAVSNWNLAWSFTAGEAVTSLWGGNYTQTGAAVSVTAPSWATSIAAGGNAVVGFTGTSTGTPAVPASFTLNGKACTKA